MNATTHHRPGVRVVVAYFSLFIVWGSTYLAIRIGVMDIPPALLAGMRFLASGSILLAGGKIWNRPFPASGPGWRHLAVIGMFLLVGGNGLVVWSEQWVPSGLAALIVATVPLFMSSIDAIIPGGHKLSTLGWLGILIGFGGVVVLVSPSLGITSGDQINFGGIVGLVGASFLWSIGSIYSKRHPVEGDIFINTGIQMLAGGAVLTVIGLVAGEWEAIRWTMNGVLAVVYLIVFGSIIGFTSYAYLLRHVPAAKASTYAYVNPIVAVILGALILAEPVDFRTVVATAVILGGVAIVQLARMRSA
jgi:drug/metabolite transporter (DMT)-like permease